MRKKRKRGKRKGGRKKRKKEGEEERKKEGGEKEIYLSLLITASKPLVYF